MNNEHSHGPQPHPKSRSNTARGQEDKAWPVHIDVHLEDDTTDPPTFSVHSSLPGYEETKNGKTETILTFKNNHRPGFKIHFHLHDETGKGYKFPDADDAVWSKKGDDCPDSEACEIFRPLRVKDDGPFDVPMLVVYFPNEQNIGRFRYTLNVTKTDGKPYLQLDPGGDGLNGPRTLR